MEWRDRLGEKLVSAERAVAHVKSGDTVAVAPYTCTPQTLCRALSEYGKKGGLKDVRIDHPASLCSWTEPGNWRRNGPRTAPCASRSWARGPAAWR